ncbi:MAG: hypothetical protein ABWW65_00745 [Thermoprotei archaeon]
MKRVYTLALSDPSIVELITISIGIISSVVGFFYLLVNLAYRAGLSASPINPTGQVPGYVSEIHQPIPILSPDTIRVTAAHAFLHYLFSSKLEFWLIYLISLFITVYPITTRFGNTIIPAMSVTGRSLGSIILAGFLPIMLFSLGHILVFTTMSVSVYMLYFCTDIDSLFLSTIAAVSLFMVLAVIIFYNAFITTGKAYFGAVLGFLLSLGIDRINLTVNDLILLCTSLIVINLVFLAIAISRRWLYI